jgi:geranylgeranyl transferase type-2 subunit alpha
MDSVVEKELEFSVETIKANCKSYGAWFHRKWLSGVLGGDLNLALELKLCSKLLELDSRNFHCWNYRIQLFQRFRLIESQEEIEKEIDFTTLMVYKNFSNYSAWHRRSVMLTLLDGGGGKLANQVVGDLALVRSAYYTEPYDQSCWFYLKWLLCTFVHARANDLGSLSVPELISQEIRNIKELVKLEPGCSLAVCTLLELGDLDASVTKSSVDYGLRRGMFTEMYRSPKLC